MPATPTVTGDDIDLADLPPLDGDDSEKDGPHPGAPARGTGDEDIGSDGGSDDLDDSTGENDALHPDDLEVDAGEGKWLEEPSDAKDLDIGEVEIDTVDVSAAGDADEDEPMTEDASVGEGNDTGGLDSGEEGPQAPDEELRDQDLPDLGEAEDDEVSEDLTLADLPSSEEPLGLGWAPHPWARVGAPVPVVAAAAVACTARGAFVVGVAERGGPGKRPAALFRVDLEGGCQPIATDGIAGPLAAVSADGDLVAVRTETEVFVARGGASFTSMSDLPDASEVVVASGVVWARSEGGKLFACTTASGRFVEQPSGAVVVGLAADGAGQVTALLADHADRPVGVVRSLRDGSLRKEPIVLVGLVGGAEAYGPPRRGVIAAHGSRIAYVSRAGVVSGGVGGSWHEHALTGHVIALAFVDRGEGLVAAVYSDSDDTTGLVRIDGDGPPRVMALLGPTQADMESDGKALGLASDDARGVVWVVGGFGVAAFSIR
jgi:hypothetical protein